MQIHLISEALRERACQQIWDAPGGYTMKLAPPKRSLDQNAKLWAMLHDIADAAPEDRHWTPDVWKAGFMHALAIDQAQVYPALDSRGTFAYGYRSSRLTVAQMSDLIMTVQEYGDRHRVRWSEPNPYEVAP